MDDALRFELSAPERESFFTAIERHRRAAWRVTAASAVAIVIASFITAMLLAPLFYAVLGLLADLVNLATPTKNLLGDFIVYVDDWQDSPDAVPVLQWVVWVFWAMLPGALCLGTLVFALNRALRVVAEHDVAHLQARVPEALTLEEQRLRNVIAEMSIAANLLPPRILIADTPQRGAGLFATRDQPTIVISRALLAQLDRAELTGVSAHLVASLANGDVAIGHRAAVTLAFFNVMSRFATVFNAPGAGAELARILAALLWPTRARIEAIADSLGTSFTDGRVVETPTKLGTSPQDWAKLVLMGPVIMTGFFGGIVAFLLLAPLLALAWRQRKYMADATAVRLTRDPDTLARALEKMGGGSALGHWSDHLAVTGGPTGGGRLMAAGAVSMFPSPERRLRALQKLGATLTAPLKERWPLKTRLIVGALLSVVGVLTAVLLPLLVYVSCALSMIFLGLPLSILHLALRWLGH